MSDSYMSSYDRLDRRDRRIALDTMRALVKHRKGNALQIHKLDRTRCDSSFRSARCNLNLRIIFSDQGDKLILLYVDNHDDAYKWAEGKFLHINNFGALYLFNSVLETEKKYENNVIQFPNRFQKSLLEKQGLKVKDLIKLGIENVHAEYLYEIADEDKFVEYITVFPEEIQEALLDLASGSKTMTEVYADLVDNTVDNNDKSINNALNHKNSKRRFVVIDNISDMEKILEGDFEKWKLFLHPKQKEIVEKNYNGPVIIQGGPGTGKTVVALHRAVYISKNVYKKSENKNILLCTYSKKLAFYIENKLNMLLSKENLERNIEVWGVDSLFYNICKKYNLTDKKIDFYRIDELFKYVYDSIQPDEPLLFYQTEYKEIIQKYNITSEREYLMVQRTGLGKAIQPSTRKRIWNFFEKLLWLLDKEKVMDFEDQAYIIYDAIKNKIIPPQFDSIIVDESQDLSPVKLKVLYSLVRSNNNNFMLLYDPNQTIYQLTSWRKDVNIDIVGRSHFLDLNYRTTKQIKEYADDQFIYSEKVTEHLRNYKSVLSGPEPEVHEFNEISKQFDFAISKIENWLDHGIKPHEIGVILSSKKSANKFSGVLTYKGIKNTVLEGNIYPSEENGVGLVSVQGCKGLEFRVVILINYTDNDWNVDYENADDWYTQLKLRQVECQKYVATTRAREELVVTFML